MVAESALPNSEQEPPADLLETRAVIEQAKGILMVTFRCSPSEAFELLCVASRGGGKKVHVLAAKLVELAAHGALLRTQSRTQPPCNSTENSQELWLEQQRWAQTHRDASACRHSASSAGLAVIDDPRPHMVMGR